MLSVDGHLDTEQMLHLANAKSACCSISKDNTAKIPNRQHGCQIYRKYICVLYPIITSTCEQWQYFFHFVWEDFKLGSSSFSKNF